jgi:hypothetical protein
MQPAGQQMRQSTRAAWREPSFAAKSDGHLAPVVFALIAFAGYRVDVDEDCGQLLAAAA